VRAVVLFSGGIDSTTLLYKLVHEGYDCMALSVDYGQTHLKELESASKIAGLVGVPYQRTFIDHSLFKGSDLTGGDGDFARGRGR
jgi:7-cyano-7-deazaguanine synthase